MRINFIVLCHSVVYLRDTLRLCMCECVLCSLQCLQLRKCEKSLYCHHNILNKYFNSIFSFGTIFAHRANKNTKLRQIKISIGKKVLFKNVYSLQFMKEKPCPFPNLSNLWTFFVEDVKRT